MRRAFLAGVLGAAALSCGDPLVRIEQATIPAGPVTAGPRVEATWMGTAGVLLDDGTTALLIDPFVSRPSLGRVAFARPIPVDEARIDLWMAMPGIERTAAVFVSHSHYDHSMDAPSFARRTDARVVGSASTMLVGRAAGLDDSQLEPVVAGEAMRFGDFTVTMLRSRHGPAVFGREPYPGEIAPGVTMPAKAREYRTGGAYAVVVEHPAGVLVHHASAGFVPQMFDEVEADVVLLGLAGRKDTRDYLRAVVDATGARSVVPIHYDNFFRGFDEPLAPLQSARIDEFLDHVADTRPDLRVRTLPLGRARPVLAP
ncbi:MAG: MBL fold metallo-hydrolase [Myxococcota bacterium]